MTVALLFILMVLPCADRRVDETSKEEEKTDKQYDTGHASVKSMSFSHTVGLTYKGFLNVGPAVWAGSGWVLQRYYQGEERNKPAFTLH